MRGITWKRAACNILEGFVKDPKYNNEPIFSIQGWSVVDLRESRFSKTFILPKYYKGKDKDNSKRIAEDLYNNVNLELHEQNRQAIIEESRRTAQIMRKANTLLKRLQKLNN